MSDLLSDKKIKQLCVKYLAWDEPVSNRDLELIKPLIKAQAKKLVERLATKNVIAMGRKKSLDEIGLLLTMEDWQALKKEVEDE